MSLLNADTLIPHISNVTSWNYNLNNNTYSSEYGTSLYMEICMGFIFFLKGTRGVVYPIV